MGRDDHVRKVDQRVLGCQPRILAGSSSRSSRPAMAILPVHQRLVQRASRLQLATRAVLVRMTSGLSRLISRSPIRWWVSVLSVAIGYGRNPPGQQLIQLDLGGSGCGDQIRAEKRIVNQPLAAKGFHPLPDQATDLAKTNQAKGRLAQALDTPARLPLPDALCCTPWW
jgi:hypothetical protein